MAFKKLQRNNKSAISFKEKEWQKKPFIGFLVDLKRNVGKFKSNIFVFQTEDGEKQEVWGNAGIDANLTVDGKGNMLDPTIEGKLVKLTYLGTVKIKGRKEPMKDIGVEVDFDSSLPESGEDYMDTKKVKKKVYKLKK